MTIEQLEALREWVKAEIAGALEDRFFRDLYPDKIPDRTPSQGYAENCYQEVIKLFKV